MYMLPCGRYTGALWFCFACRGRWLEEPLYLTQSMATLARVTPSYYWEKGPESAWLFSTP